jgi:DNA excision repair protein ERCC-4
VADANEQDQFSRTSGIVGCNENAREANPGAFNLLGTSLETIMARCLMNGKMTLPFDIPSESIIAIQDTREQTPWKLGPFGTEIGTLATGDYTVKHLEHVISIERKSLSDLLGCVGGERERFERELQRMLAYPTRAVIVESNWTELEEGDWQSRVTPASVIGSVLGWMAMGIPFILADTHEKASKVASKMLYIAARRRWREARGLLSGISVTESEVKE